MEFINGVLIPRSTPTIPHSLLQKLLLLWFAQFEDDSGYEAIQEVRTQIVERARYRVPDLMICPRPLQSRRICNVVPWAIVEILSPDDTLTDTLDRFEDYKQIGVQSLVLMDPERYLAYEFRGASLIARPFQTLDLPDSRTIPFDTGRLFAQLQQRLRNT